MSIWCHLEEQIATATGQPFVIEDKTEIGGGCINRGLRLSDNKRALFVKLNASKFADMFEAEALGLQTIAESNTLMVPVPICFGVFEKNAYIVMQYLELTGRADDVALGRGLAAMHQVYSKTFGWSRDNTIGSTPQHNRVSENWCHFWAEHRLGFQLELAAINGYGGKLQLLGEQLLSAFPALFESYQPQASMLHGDLWGGNYGGLADGSPVIFDPAFYYGDRETDLAMTTLFGGFSADFYAAYDEVLPLEKGYAIRKQFYNIYHVINHLNLFGGGYQAQAVSMMQNVLAHLR